MSVPAMLMPEVDFMVDEIPDLHERLARLREEGPMVRVKVFGEPSWMLIDHGDVDKAFRDYDIFDVTRYNLEVALPYSGRALLALEGAEHSLQRGLMNPSFSVARARDYIESIIEPTVHELLDRIEGQQQVDLRQAFCKPFPFTVITKLMGIPVEDEPRMIRLAGEMLSYMYTPDVALAAKHAFDAFIKPLVDERRRNPTEDLISQFIEMEMDGEKLEEESILTFLRLLYPAGGHSTSLNVGTAAYCMLADPEVRAAVKRGGKELSLVVQEALRWEPALGIIPRMIGREADFRGVHLTRADTVYLSITAANDDPRIFPEPRKFDPTRKNLANLMTFGRDAHMCLGRYLAMREIEVALRVLCERFPDMELLPDRPVRFSGTLFRTCEDLWVRPHGR